ncbi:MAG: pectinesterase family protein [Ignavibacteriales bacterium]|nr:pectinesterase family protein [Ignavibacteriales bacterium]
MKIRATMILVLAWSGLLFAQTTRIVPGAYPTISDAVKGASAGDTILIGRGTYAEQLVLKKNLTLIGAGQDKTVIVETPAGPDSTALIIDTATVTIKGIQFFGEAQNGFGKRGLIARNATTTLTQCAFVLFSNVSIAAINGRLTIDSVTISSLNGGDRVMVDSTSNLVGISSDIGVLLMNARFSISRLTAGAQIDHIIDVRPNVHDIPTFLGRDYPADTSQYNEGTIENSTFFGSRLSYWGQGIRVFGYQTGHRAELVIRNNRFAGMVKDSSYAIPSLLTTAGISFNGWSAFADIYGNVIQHFNSGISLYGAASASIHDNEITWNGRYGVVTSWTSPANQPDLGGGTLSSPGRNTISNNGKYNIYNQNSLSLSARFNNWGTTDANIIDSLIYDQRENSSIGRVDFSGYLTPKPAAPSLMSPADGSTGVAATPTLTWNNIGNATTYRLQVSASATFVPVLIDDSTLTTPSRQIGPLTDGTKYYWRVSASNAGGASGWSLTRNLTTLRIRFDISGTVRYGSSSGPAVQGVTASFSSATSPASSGASNAQGVFTLSSIPIGTYTCSFAKSGGHPTQYTNAADALKAALFSVDSLTYPLTTIQRLAADVNSDGKINAADALQIMLRYAGAVSSFAKGDWVFSAASSSVAISNQDVINDVVGLAAGDVNGDAQGALPAGTGTKK